jgi:1-acyl-sn-glycerol-3-phosphate acyltransferase
MAIFKSIFFLLVATFWLLVLFPLACLAMLLTLDQGASIWWARKVWSPVLLWFSGARIVIEGQENVDPARPTIYVSNHQSALDIPLLFVAIPCNVRFIAKKQIAWVPVLGWYMWMAGYVFVDRGNREKAIASLDKAGRQIRGGTSIIVYPEGTRSYDGKVLPFKKGPFALALKARVPICPVTIEGSWRVMPRNSWNVVWGQTIRVKIGKPVDISRYGDRDREALVRDIRAAIIQQSLELGGKGGDQDRASGASDYESVGRTAEAS